MYTFCINKVVYSKGGFFIFKGSINGEVYHASGNIPEFINLKNIKGLTIKIKGNIKNTKYGKTIYFKEYQLDNEDLASYFLFFGVPGIGPKTANKIILKFGHKNLQSILENNIEVLKEVDGISDKKIRVISECFKEYKNLQELKSFLVDIPNYILMRIYNKFREQGNVVEYIRENPYRLVYVNKLQFRTIDDIAIKLNFNVPTERIRFASIYILLEHVKKTGSTCMPVVKLVEKVHRLLEGRVSEDEIASITYHYKLEDIEYMDDYIGLLSYYRMEDYIWDFFSFKDLSQLDNVSSSLIERKIKEFESVNNINLSDEQKEAIFKAFERRLFILTGYAGTGKTTVTKVIADILKETYGSENIIGCAMSGIASKRLSDLAKIEAKTIHSLLGYNGYTFKYDRDNRLPYQVVIVDECGMISVELFYYLINALPKHCVLILIGDNAQLPPIGGGNIFHDIVASEKLPIHRLTKVFRQSEDSVVNIFASQIRKKTIPINYNTNNKYIDWFFYDLIDTNDMIKESEEIKKEESSKALNFLKMIINRAYESGKIQDKIYDLQVLSPMKEGVMGVHNLNDVIQEIVNPISQKSFNDYKSVRVNGKTRYFCVGDKVVHLENKDMPISYVDNERKQDFEEDVYMEKVFNGTLGVVVKIIHTLNMVKVKTTDGRFVYYRESDLFNIVDLAYCLTVHKAQGSEFKNVLIPIISSYKTMLTNQWLYTAITRGKKKVVIFGNKKYFEYGCLNDGNFEKNTWLNLKFETVGKGYFIEEDYLDIRKKDALYG
jgi:exodeoxyribonuclease V alpha subunit